MSEHDREQHSSEKKGNKERAERVARIIAEAPWHQEESSSEEEPTGASSSWSREAGQAADSGQEPRWRPRRWQRRQEEREGDWLCPVCGELVFAFRKACIKCVWRERARVQGKGKGKGSGKRKGKRLSEKAQDFVHRLEDVPGSSQEEARPSEQQGSKPESEDEDEWHPSSEGKDEPDEEGPKEQRKESEEPPDWGGDEDAQESGESEPEFLEDPAEGKDGIDEDDL